MSSYVRVTHSHWLSTDPRADKVTSTVYFKKSATWANSTDYDALATDVLAAFNFNAGVHMCGSDRTKVVVYSMEDPEPRQPKATKTANIALVGAGPREVALCLSFRGAQNVPRQRGRIYLGPFAPADMLERPSQGLRDTCRSLNGRLAGIGGIDVDWCVFSPTTYGITGDYGQSFHPIKAAWMDDAWDTVRSRGLAPQLRNTSTLDE